MAELAQSGISPGTRARGFAGLGLATDARRPLALAGLGLLSLAGYAGIWPLMPAGIANILSPIALVTAALAVPYALACWLLLGVPTPTSAGWRRVEWGVLLGGTALFRAALFPLVPVLSRDAYRYAWDALLTAHGFSPYLHAPDWPGFDRLRDAFYPHVPWKTVPTIYPPGAQLLYRLAYLVAPKNVWAIKAEMVAFDLLAGLLLALLLRRHGQDTRRAFIYLWSPLPVVEFALNGHVDAAAIALVLLILLVNAMSFPGARALVGGLLGFATLVKLYPLVLVVAVVRRRDWTLLAALGATLVAGYLPFWREGLAAFGFLSDYLLKRDSNLGAVPLLLRALATSTHAGDNAAREVDVLAAAVGIAVVVRLRLRPRWPANAGLTFSPTLSPVLAAYALVALWLIFAPHVFAWYVPALLPLCALYLPARTPRAPVLQGRDASDIAAVCAGGVWAFCCLIPLSYVAFEAPGWAWLYPALYPACLALAFGVWLWQRRAHASPALVLNASPAVPATPDANPDDVSPLRVS